MRDGPEWNLHHGTTRTRYLLTGLAWCGRPGCVGRMRVVAQTGRPRRYACRTCHKISRYREPVDAMVERLLVARLSEPDVLAGPGADDGDVAAAADELSLIECRSLRARVEPKLVDAERPARPRTVPAAVVEVDGPEAAVR